MRPGAGGGVGGISYCAVEMPLLPPLYMLLWNRHKAISVLAEFSLYGRERGSEGHGAIRCQCVHVCFRTVISNTQMKTFKKETRRLAEKKITRLGKVGSHSRWKEIPSSLMQKWWLRLIIILSGAQTHLKFIPVHKCISSASRTTSTFHQLMLMKANISPAGI